MALVGSGWLWRHPRLVIPINWLNTNKISLNLKRTETILFKSIRKKFNDIVKINLCGKRIHSTASAKYLGVKIDQYLT